MPRAGSVLLALEVRGPCDLKRDAASSTNASRTFPQGFWCYAMWCLGWRIQSHRAHDGHPKPSGSQLLAYGQWVLAKDRWHLWLSWQQNILHRCLRLGRAGMLWVDRKRENRNSSQES